MSKKSRVHPGLHFKRGGGFTSVWLFFFSSLLTFAFSQPLLLARCESVQPFSLIHLGCIGPMSEENGEQLEQIKAQKISRPGGGLLDLKAVPRPKDSHRYHRGTATSSEWQVPSFFSSNWKQCNWSYKAGNKPEAPSQGRTLVSGERVPPEHSFKSAERCHLWALGQQLWIFTSLSRFNRELMFEKGCRRGSALWWVLRGSSKYSTVIRKVAHQSPT